MSICMVSIATGSGKSRRKGSWRVQMTEKQETNLRVWLASLQTSEAIASSGIRPAPSNPLADLPIEFVRASGEMVEWLGRNPHRSKTPTRLDDQRLARRPPS